MINPRQFGSYEEHGKYLGMGVGRSAGGGEIPVNMSVWVNNKPPGSAHPDMYSKRLKGSAKFNAYEHGARMSSN